MTCIVGIRHDSGVLLGGDSVGCDSGGNAQMRRDPKVFLLNRHVAIGYTSSFRMGQLLRFNLQLPAIVDAVGDKVTTDEFEWAVKQFIPACRTALKDGGYARSESGEDRGGFFLLAVRSRLFEIASDFQVGEPTPHYVSTGSGEQYAMGALHALMTPNAPLLNAKRARELATKALEASVYHSAYVRPPFEFVETQP